MNSRKDKDYWDKITLLIDFSDYGIHKDEDDRNYLVYNVQETFLLISYLYSGNKESLCNK